MTTKERDEIAARDALVVLMGVRLAENLIRQLHAAGFKIVRIKK